MIRETLNEHISQIGVGVGGAARNISFKPVEMGGGDKKRPVMKIMKTNEASKIKLHIPVMRGLKLDSQNHSYAFN